MALFKVDNLIEQILSWRKSHTLVKSENISEMTIHLLMRKQMAGQVKIKPVKLVGRSQKNSVGSGRPGR